MTIKNFNKIWKISLTAYIASMIAFADFSSTTIINTLSLYLFLFISIIGVFINGKIYISKFVLSLLLWVTVVLVGLLYTPTAGDLFMMFYQFITTIIIVIFVLQYLKLSGSLNDIVNSYIWGGILLLALAINVYGFEIFIKMATSIFEFRAGDELGNTNIVGLKFAFLVILVFYKMMFNKNSKIQNLGYILLSILGFMFMMMTGSRKSIIALIYAISMLSLFKVFTFPKDKRYKYLVFFSTIIVAVVVMVFTLDVFKNIANRLLSIIDIFDESQISETDEIRKEYIKIGFQVFLENPIFGRGSFASYYYFNTYSHNNYVEILMSHGVIGFIIFYFPYVQALIQTVKSKNYNFKALGFVFITLMLGMGIILVYTSDRFILIIISAVLMTAFERRGVELKNDQKIYSQVN